MKGIRVISNGTPQETHVYNDEDGTEIKGISELTIVATSKGVFARMTITVSSIMAHGVQLEIEKEKA